MGYDYYMNPFAEWVGWFPKHMPREERVLVNKLDFLILVFACLSTWANNLDVNAIYNAYVSGMEADLELTGNRLNYLNAVYWVGTIVFQLPSNALLTVVPAEYYVPTCEVAWGMFTLGTAFVKNYKQLMVMRFFVGVTSTPCWICNVAIINSWYRKQELGKRNAVYYCTYPLGSMFSGYLQNACLTLDGKGGLEGWRWLFIVCTIITIPISAVGVFFYPNVPSHCKSRWLTPREKELAQTRLLEEGFAPSVGLDRRILKKVFSAWQTWVFFVLANLFWQTPYASTTPYLLWLGDEIYNSGSVYDTNMTNNLSTVGYAISIVSAMFFAFYSDWTRRRWDSMVLAGVVVLVCNSMLMYWKISNAAKFFAFIALGFCNGPINLVLAWVAESLAHDLEVRALALAFVNMGYCILALILPLSAWQTVDAPRYYAGYIWSVVISVLELILIPLPMYLDRRDEKLGLRKVATHDFKPNGVDEISFEVVESELKGEKQVNVSVTEA
ncbi:major facilitator superfamily domain-containing protein [Dipodascopsis tothii]|uniref:major facilitator superfamily domain-containing protein n=1 Tax=Dipodascopsis tothii TaxID=44089 RepID=UPI0034CF909F